MKRKLGWQYAHRHIDNSSFFGCLSFTLLFRLHVLEEYQCQSNGNKLLSLFKLDTRGVGMKMVALLQRI